MICQGEGGFRPSRGIQPGTSVRMALRCVAACVCLTIFLDSRPTPLQVLFTNASCLTPLLFSRLAICICTIPPSREAEEEGRRVAVKDG